MQIKGWIKFKNIGSN